MMLPHNTLSHIKIITPPSRHYPPTTATNTTTTTTTTTTTNTTSKGQKESTSLPELQQQRRRAEARQPMKYNTGVKGGGPSRITSKTLPTKSNDQQRTANTKSAE